MKSKFDECNTDDLNTSRRDPQWDPAIVLLKTRWCVFSILCECITGYWCIRVCRLGGSVVICIDSARFDENSRSRMENDWLSSHSTGGSQLYDRTSRHVMGKYRNGKVCTYATELLYLIVNDLRDVNHVYFLSDKLWSCIATIRISFQEKTNICFSCRKVFLSWRKTIDRFSCTCYCTSRKYLSACTNLNSRSDGDEKCVEERRW